MEGENKPTDRHIETEKRGGRDEADGDSPAYLSGILHIL